MILRGPILNPRADGTVEFIPDGILSSNDKFNRIDFVGPWSRFDSDQFDRAEGVICPAFFDNHIHIPQHPIRGRFVEGVGPNPPQGRLLAGLERNVFPAESKCADATYTREVVESFLEDTLSKGVIGGCAYMTVHTDAARTAFQLLPDLWRLGPVLMEMNCPTYLRSDPASWYPGLESLARDFGQRLIVTDRFAVAVGSDMRRRAVELAKRFSLRMQTHLNEQQNEKRFVEKQLYPDAASYTDVYERDGLLDCEPILAHCIWMEDSEYALLASHRGIAVAHCPTSNALLGSGVMKLSPYEDRNIPISLCTDVGASPTTSLLAEMATFVRVHANEATLGSAERAFYLATRAAAEVHGCAERYGSLDVGRSMTFAVLEADCSNMEAMSAERFIRERILQLPEASRELDHAVRDEGLEAGGDLSLIEADIAAHARRLDNVVRQVFLDGSLRWKRR